MALSAALTGSAAPALAAGDYWDVDRLDWYYDRWIDNGAEAWYREAPLFVNRQFPPNQQSGRSVAGPAALLYRWYSNSRL